MATVKLDWETDLYGIAAFLGGRDDSGEIIGDRDYFGSDGMIRPLLALNGYRQVAEVVEKDIRTFVWKARKEGATWQQVADALGISRQAAHKRFSR